ncbi:NUDIX hydrolase [Alkaliphilus serpentinus]|uniref:8-oxo-dGTP diphosphatase n=1 Tax=Alkaliphilus serpentinus TaxID=1482731 RepID=A0A833HNL0_9FIRM|nr:8-oxo-dGTP diphosphatase [Alkaliphilus serpentinus]KAB3529605.1 8-oxo-dGTP diphosphatase [Alkaliphilus serpentinus]
MLKYTLCFIKCGEKILLLNRERPGWMGSWNGVGGLIEEKEKPIESAIREIWEETAISVDELDFKGVVTWKNEKGLIEGMYVFIVEVAETYIFNSPIKTEEGILDWKEMNWIFNSKNTGIVSNIPKFLSHMLESNELYEYNCIYEGCILKDISINRIRDDFINKVKEIKNKCG